MTKNDDKHTNALIDFVCLITPPIMIVCSIVLVVGMMGKWLS